MRTEADLSKLVAQSGFPLQAGVDKFVTDRVDQIGWKVLYREHGWKHADGQSGFIDLVLEDRYGSSLLVLECKRVLEADWLFLTSDAAEAPVRSARIWITNTKGHGQAHFGYYDARVAPESEEAMFCVVAGQDTKSRPMLERVAAEALAATEALAAEEKQWIDQRDYGLRMYAPVIVTTARLHMSRFDAAKVRMETGEPDAVVHKEVPWVRFRKQFSPELAVKPKDIDWDFGALARAKEKLAFVVNVMHLPTFLSKWDVASASLRSLM